MQLTPRQTLAFRALLDGVPNTVAAKRWGITPSAVSQRRRYARKKLGIERENGGRRRRVRARQLSIFENV